MTVAFDQPTFVQTPGNGAATVYAVPYKIFAATDLVVGFITGGIYIQQTTGFTVGSIDQNGGATVTFVTPPPVGTTVDIRSLTPKTQPTEFANLGAYLPESTTEACDRFTRVAQDLARLCYTFGIHGPDQEGIAWPALPTAPARAGMLLAFDVNGLPITATMASNIATGANVLGLIGDQGYRYKAAPWEQAAGITPTVFGWDPGWPQRYGFLYDTNPANATNQQAAQNAITANAGFADVIFDGGGIAGGYGGGFTGPLTVPAYTHIRFANHTELRWTSTAPNSGPSWVGTSSRPGFWVQGSYVTIEGDGVVSGPTPVTGANGLPGGTISGGTFVGGAGGAEQAIIALGPGVSSPFTKIDVRDIEIRWWGTDGIALEYCERSNVERTNVHDVGYHGIVLLSCLTSNVHKNKVSYVDPGFASGVPNAYGISFSADSRSATAGTSRADADPGCISCRMEDNDIDNIPRWTGCDMHGGWDNTVKGNKVYNCAIGCGGGGINPASGSVYWGGDNACIEENIIDVSQRNGAASTILQLTPNNASNQNFRAGITCQGGTGRQSRKPRVLNNRLVGYGDFVGATTTPGAYAIGVQFCDYPEVSKNVLDGCRTTGIYWAANTGGRIEANESGAVDQAIVWSNDAFIYLNSFNTPPLVVGNIHRLNSGTGWHFGLQIFSTQGRVMVGPNDFGSAQTAQYANEVGGHAAAASFLGLNQPFAFNGANPQSPDAGWGTPTGGNQISNYPGASATLVQTSTAVAQLIADLKALGILAA